MLQIDDAFQNTGFDVFDLRVDICKALGELGNGFD